MRTTYLCFNLKSISCSVDSNKIYEKDYNLVYKPLIQFLYSHPEFPFSLTLNGNQLTYFRNRKNEVLTLLKQLIQRKQIEIIGSGYYDPILPLLYSADRSGQIERFHEEISHSLSKRPDGLALYNDIWDPSIINNFSTWTIYYILLDSTLIPEEKKLFLPLVMSILGKSVQIYPSYDDLNPNSDMSCEEFVNNIISRIESVEKHSESYELPEERLVNISLNHDEMYKLNDSKWFLKLNEYLQNREDIVLTLPKSIYKDFETKCPAYIPAGISNNLSKYITSPYKAVTPKKNSHYTIYDYFETYKQSHNLYCSMIYISNVVNQAKNDKQRKLSAREELWKAQSGNSLIWSPINIKNNLKARREAYKVLMNVQHILREEGTFKESVSKYAYKLDGVENYICQMDGYFAFIDKKGGSVQELDLYHNCLGNYADNMSRIQAFDGYDDTYNRGLFMDHIFTDRQFASYVNNEESSNGIFASITYKQLDLLPAKREVHLAATATLKNGIPIYLKKSYRIDSNGMNVRYIIRNDGEKKLKTKFAVESNFACLNYNSTNVNYYKLDVIANNDIYYINDDKKLVSGDKNRLNNKLESSEIETTDYDNLVNDVTSLRVTDIENEIAFSFEPNEKCGFCFNTIEFIRPDINDQLVKVEKTFVSTLFWDLEVEPGRETEKNISFTISSVKKLKK